MEDIKEMLEGLIVKNGIKKTLHRGNESILLVSDGGWFNNQYFEFEWIEKGYFTDPKMAEEMGFELTRKEKDFLSSKGYHILIYNFKQ